MYSHPCSSSVLMFQFGLKCIFLKSRFAGKPWVTEPCTSLHFEPRTIAPMSTPRCTAAKHRILAAPYSAETSGSEPVSTTDFCPSQWYVWQTHESQVQTERHLSSLLIHLTDTWTSGPIMWRYFFKLMYYFVEIKSRDYLIFYLLCWFQMVLW